MKFNKLKYANKGWSTSEIDHACSIIDSAETNKKHSRVIFDKTIYLTLLFLLIIGNMLISALLIPFLFAFKGDSIILLVTFFGFVFGVFFSILIADINKHENKNDLKLIFTLILSGILSFILIIVLSFESSRLTGLTLAHSPYLVAGIYLFAFLTPHIMLIIENNKN